MWVRKESVILYPETHVLAKHTIDNDVDDDDCHHHHDHYLKDDNVYTTMSITTSTSTSTSTSASMKNYDYHNFMLREFSCGKDENITNENSTSTIN